MMLSEAGEGQGIECASAAPDRAVRALSWGLMVATYRREKILPLCLKLAAEQSRPPAEVTVVDASPDWERTRALVLDKLASQHAAIRWSYQRARVRSSTCQRNQAMESATADVLFFMDDDSLMYPGCAEQIMQVYEADVGEEIAGVQGQAASAPPVDTNGAGEQKASGSASGDVHLNGGMSGKLKAWVWRNVFLMDTSKLFLPYDGDFPRRALPAHMAGLDVALVHLFQGYRMTYRRNVIAQVGFDPLLRYYAAGEDLDASYRASRYGLLVVALRALIHHYRSAEGRLGRDTVTALGLLNQAVLLRKHAADVPKMKRMYYARALHRVLVEMIKDGLSLRWTLPQVRGTLAAMVGALQAFSVPDDELAAWYEHLQEQILGRG